jgi:hypothetical protein
MWRNGLELGQRYEVRKTIQYNMKRGIVGVDEEAKRGLTETR